MKIKLDKKSGSILIAAILALIGLIIYSITSVTGYLMASAVNPWPIICTAASMILLAATVFVADKLSAVIKDAMIALASVLLLISFYFFVMSRVQLAADVYFIPVNYPASEATALHISIVGVVFYLAADIAIIVSAFMNKREREALLKDERDSV